MQCARDQSNSLWMDYNNNNKRSRQLSWLSENDRPPIAIDFKWKTLISVWCCLADSHATGKWFSQKRIHSSRWSRPGMAAASCPFYRTNNNDCFVILILSFFVCAQVTIPFTVLALTASAAMWEVSVSFLCILLVLSVHTFVHMWSERWDNLSGVRGGSRFTFYVFFF